MLLILSSTPISNHYGLCLYPCLDIPTKSKSRLKINKCWLRAVKHAMGMGNIGTLVANLAVIAISCPLRSFSFLGHACWGATFFDTNR